MMKSLKSSFRHSTRPRIRSSTLVVPERGISNRITDGPPWASSSSRWAPVKSRHLPVVARKSLSSSLVRPHLLQTLGGTVAAVGESLVHHSLGCGLIMVETLGLQVRFVGAANSGALVVIDSQPLQPFQHGFLGSGLEPFLIGVFHP